MPAARRSSDKDSLAGVAGERVRAIIEAAEASAEAIRAEAEAEAERITARAQERASALRSEVRSDVAALIASIREGVDRLRGDLEALEQRLGEPEAESAASAAPEPAKAAARPAASAEPAKAAARPAASAEPAKAAAEMEDADLALAEDTAVGPPEPRDSAPPDHEGARLVALNMALDGASRDEVGRHLRENHGVSEPEPLLDEVYTSIGRG